MNPAIARRLRAIVDERGTRFTGTGNASDFINVVDNNGAVRPNDPLAEYKHYLDSEKI